jgi:hypothetical protein
VELLGSNHGSDHGHGSGLGNGRNGFGDGLSCGGGFGNGVGHLDCAGFKDGGAGGNGGCPPQYAIYGLSLAWAITNVELEVRYV